MKTIYNRVFKMWCISWISTLTFIQISCKKQVEVDAPASSFNAANIYTDDATATSVLTGIYTNLSITNQNLDRGGFTSISLFSSLSADELTLYDLNNSTFANYYNNTLTSSPSTSTADYWSVIYPIVFVSNSAIEGLTSSTKLTPVIKQQLLGEAKFIRAFCYFYLVNLYGDVPIVTSSDWTVNASQSRASKSQVYQQFITDLNDAKDLLSPNYLKGDLLTTTSERVRPTKWAAIALLSRAYLYNGDWANAELNATSVINNNSYYDTVPLNSVFLKNNKEAIWQLQAVGSGVKSNTGEGRIFILPQTGPNSTSYPVFLSANVMNSFETNDQRKVNWIGSVTPTPPGTQTYYYPNKYKIGAVNTSVQEYSTVFRLGEQYLIRAEARAQQNNISGAQADLNIIRTRAGLPNTTASDKTSLITAILHERQVELFTEWGHRWFDIKRTGNVDGIMTSACSQKGGTWATYKSLYPIPLSELKKAPQLIQNPGY